ncbi:AfsR/SARP family transcriptional regulator [Actinomadura hibisca]|uniref:AfsR/SARP family transcriptional regulator n=1 Tax=Actinomadura hibisca TaxID=68565 RepID=UPI00082A001E|nr:BTAD domain-containing putative transcriptional regulator [Actinomadura hibisca]
MRIGILGPLAVRDAAGRPVEVSGARLRALLIRLALDPGRAVSADRLLDDLWEGAPPAGGAGALQALVSRLRNAAGRDLVEHGPGGYLLAVDPAEVDAAAFGRAVAAARAETAPAARAAAFRKALELWRGPALADVADADFAAATVARLEEQRLAAIEDRADAELSLGEATAQIAELEALVAAHPLRERLRGLLMRSLHAAGRTAEALHSYEQARRILAERLGADPSPELAAVHLALLRDEPAAPEPPPAAPPEPRTNLPAQLTSFVGREDESRRVGKMLREARLVTLIGPGGAGKTRLSAEAAAPLLCDQPDGVWFVPLAPVAGEGPAVVEDIATTVLTAMGVPDAVKTGETWTGTRQLDRLADVLAPRRALLVLDNCEHLVEAAAVVVDRLLAAAPGVRVLATSREPLGITGESLCHVPSLPLPPADADAAEALRHASVRLFADRAAAVRPGFAVDDETAPQVVAVCRALDGIPLAIELAAARLRSLTPAQVAARLHDRFRLLTGGSRAALPRHRTMRAVVDWSWELLDDTERTVLRRLSVFAGGATPEAAARVCLPGGDPDEVVDVIAALVDKSLVMADGSAAVRYRLLETMRVYAAERLDEAGETARVRAAHVAWHLELAERAEPELRRHDQLAWADRLTAERDNFSAAFRYVVDARDEVSGLRLVRELLWFWLMRDLEREAGGWAVAVYELVGDTAPPGLEEEYAVCRFTAMMIAEMGKDEGARPDSLRETFQTLYDLVPVEPRHPVMILMRPLARVFLGGNAEARAGLAEIMDHPDPWVRAAAHTGEAMLAMNDGEVERAAEQARVGYEGFAALGERGGKIMSLIALVQVAQARGDLAAAVRHGEEAYGYASQQVSPEQGASMLIELARVRSAAGDPEGARRDLERGLRETERIGDYANTASAYLWQSELQRGDGDLVSASVSLGRALELIEPRRHRADFIHVSALTLSKLGCLAEQQGDLAEARRRHAQAFEAAASAVMFSNPNLATLVEGLAAYRAAEGDLVRAAELLGLAHRVHGYRDQLSMEVDRTERAARTALGEDAFAAAYDRGRQATREDALALTP